MVSASDQPKESRTKPKELFGRRRSLSAKMVPFCYFCIPAKLQEFISERFLSRKAKRMPFSVEHCFRPLLSVCRARACGTAAATRNYHLQIGSVRPSVLRSITRGNRRQSLSLPPQLHSSPCPFVWLAALVSRFPPGPVW